MKSVVILIKIILHIVPVKHLLRRIRRREVGKHTLKETKE